MSGLLNGKLLSHLKHCQYCGREVFPQHSSANHRRTIDHKVPRSRGGVDQVSNLTVACLTCNLEKGAFTDGEYQAILHYRGLCRPPRPVCQISTCSLRKHIQWMFAFYVNNFKMAVTPYITAVVAFFLILTFRNRGSA